MTYFDDVQLASRGSSHGETEEGRLLCRGSAGGETRWYGSRRSRRSRSRRSRSTNLLVALHLELYEGRSMAFYGLGYLPLYAV